MPEIEYALQDHPAKVDEFLVAIAGHTRTLSDAPEYFVEPFAGALKQIKVKHPHIIFGRRGSGKTSLLRQAQKELRGTGHFCAFINAEQLKPLKIADALISSLRSILRQLRRWSDEGGATLSKNLISRIEGEEEELLRLLNQDEQPRIEVRDTQVLSDTERSGVSGTVVLPFFRTRGDVASAQSRVGEVSQVQLLTSDKLTQLNRRQANALAELFEDIQAQVRNDMYVMIDDFYHLGVEYQPYFINFVNGLLQQHRCWLKIGSVETRTLVRWQVGNATIGIELGQDAHELNLDRSFKEFNITNDFLSGVVAGLCAKVSLEQEQLLTDGAFNRLVQASGGVARDLLNLLSTTVKDAKERYARDKGAPRVSADDTWNAAARNYVVKKTQFGQDMDAADQRYYLLKLEDVKKFCFANDDNRLLIEMDAAADDPRDLRILWDAKFVHIVDDKIRFNGRAYIGYCLDIGTHADDWTRRRIVVDLSKGDVGKSMQDDDLVFGSTPAAVTQKG